MIVIDESILTQIRMASGGRKKNRRASHKLAPAVVHYFLNQQQPYDPIVSSSMVRRRFV
jgi:hypothetical protein